MRLHALLLLSSLAACTTVERIPGPDGEVHFSISCRRAISNCYEEAAKRCPTGYSVADKTDESVEDARRYTMLIKCK